MTTIKDVENKVPAIIRNEAFYAFARVCMIISLPVMSFLFHRVVTVADELRDQVAKQNIAIIRLTDRVEQRLGSLDDHEQRIRALEFARRSTL